MTGENPTEGKSPTEFEQLMQVVKQLRHPTKGCPWDLEQTHESLLKYLVEESFEFIHATERRETKEMEEELGDVLLQVLLHSVIAEEDQRFTFEGLAKTLREKLVRRHPHVFNDPNPDIDVSDVVANWEVIKEEEKKGADKSQVKSVIKDKVLHNTALEAAHKIGKKTQKIGFDWNNANEVIPIVEEEWRELKEELKKDELSQERIEEEMGDFLFSLAQLSRHLDLKPEAALRRANQKFLHRFWEMEKLIEERGEKIQDMTQQDMDVYWGEVKQKEK